MEALENTIKTLVDQAAASVASGARVIWANQSGPRPALDFITLRVEETGRIGHPENEVTDNPSPTQGAEILIKSRSTAEFDVEIEVYSVNKVSTAARGLSAWAQLHKVRQVLEGLTVNEAADAAGVAIVSLSPIRNVPRVLETQFEGRATLTLKLRISDEYSEATTFIEKAEWTASYT